MANPTHPIYSAVACNLDTNVLRACLPLFETGTVEALEWSFDTGFGPGAQPDWFGELLTTYADAGRLLGHGVFFSLFSGRWLPEQQAWLRQLRKLSATYRFDHVTEHFGFMTGADFHKGAPLSIPLTPATLAIGRDRLSRIQDAGNCPVGLENLAFAGSVDDGNGFLILDLHNLYCQSHNFGFSPEELLSLYPLERIREMHISGGSWSSVNSEPGRNIRRDTHDGTVPAEVFQSLQRSIDCCPNLKYVVLEQIGSGLATESDQRLFSEDFLKMDQLVQAKNRTRPESQPNPFGAEARSRPDSAPIEDAQLFEQQRQLATILETALDYRQAHAMLTASGLANSAWHIEQWEPAMLETALAIAQKWRNGFP